MLSLCFTETYLKLTVNLLMQNLGNQWVKTKDQFWPTLNYQHSSLVLWQMQQRDGTPLPPSR